MPELVFFSGTMDCGKSTLALQMEHNRSARGLQGMIFTRDDRAGAGKLSSRLGLVAEAVEVADGPRLPATPGPSPDPGGRADYVIVRRGAVPLPRTGRAARARRGRSGHRRLRVRHHHRLPHPALPRLPAADRARRPAGDPPGRGAVLVRRPCHPQCPHRRRTDGGRGRAGGGRRRRRAQRTRSATRCCAAVTTAGGSPLLRRAPARSRPTSCRWTNPQRRRRCRRGVDSAIRCDEPDHTEVRTLRVRERRQPSVR